MQCNQCHMSADKYCLCNCILLCEICVKSHNEIEADHEQLSIDEYTLLLQVVPVEQDSISSFPTSLNTTYIIHQSTLIDPLNQPTTRNRSIDYHSIMVTVCRYLLLNLEYSRELELKRQFLLMRKDFSLEGIYLLIKKPLNTKILDEDFLVFLENIQLHPDDNVAKRIFDKFILCDEDNSQTKCLENIFLPKNEEYKEVIMKISGTELSSETNHRIKDLFRVIIEYEQILMQIVEEIAKISQDDLEKTLIWIDKEKKSSISVEDLQECFGVISVQISRKDALEIFGNYAIDGMIDFTNFKLLIGVSRQ